jgi:hypothetical protein
VPQALRGQEARVRPPWTLQGSLGLLGSWSPAAATRGARRRERVVVSWGEERPNPCLGCPKPHHEWSDPEIPGLAGIHPDRPPLHPFPHLTPSPPLPHPPRPGRRPSPHCRRARGPSPAAAAASQPWTPRLWRVDGTGGGRGGSGVSGCLAPGACPNRAKPAKAARPACCCLFFHTSDPPTLLYHTQPHTPTSTQTSARQPTCARSSCSPEIPKTPKTLEP